MPFVVGQTLPRGLCTRPAVRQSPVDLRRRWVVESRFCAGLAGAGSARGGGVPGSLLRLVAGTQLPVATVFDGWRTVGRNHAEPSSANQHIDKESILFQTKHNIWIAGRSKHNQTRISARATAVASVPGQGTIRRRQACLGFARRRKVVVWRSPQSAENRRGVGQVGEAAVQSFAPAGAAGAGVGVGVAQVVGAVLGEDLDQMRGLGVVLAGLG